MSRKTINSIAGEPDKLPDVSVTGLNSQCGARYIYGLGIFAGLDAKRQAIMLARVFTDHGCTQVVMSDYVVKNEKNPRCPEAKAIAFQGPISRNSNSGRDIQFYIFTSELVVDLYHSTDPKVEEVKEVVKKTPVASEVGAKKPAAKKKKVTRFFET